MLCCTLTIILVWSDDPESPAYCSGAIAGPLCKIGDPAAKAIRIAPVPARRRQQRADRPTGCLTRGRGRNKGRVVRLLRSGTCAGAGMREVHVHEHRFTGTCITSGKSGVHKALGDVNAGY